MEVLIRDARLDDAPALLEIYAYYIENTAVTYELEVPSAEEFRQRIEQTLLKYPYLVAESSGRIVGYAYAGRFHPRAAYDWSAELSIYIAKEFTHCGIGRKLYGALEKKLAQMGIVNLYACIASPDVPDEYLDGNSVEFHRHLGFRLAGTFHNCASKFGRWYSMVWMERLIGEHLPSPENVRFLSKSPQPF